MNRKLALSLGCLFAATALHAQTVTNGEIAIDPNPFVSSRSRAEVQAELDEYRRSGVDMTADSYDPLAGFRSTRSRDEVSSEYIAGRAAVAAATGEDSGSMAMARQVPAPVRDTQLATHEIAD